MKRREFITLLGGAAAWPLAARAQQGERVRRASVLIALAADDPQSPVRIAAFSQGLQELGWTIGRNIRIDYRWGAANTDNARKYAAELAAQPPDVILANGSPAVAALQKVPHNIPVVFVTVPDPIGGGFVDSMARPGGNITGFTTYEYLASARDRASFLIYNQKFKFGETAPVGTCLGGWGRQKIQKIEVASTEVGEVPCG